MDWKQYYKQRPVSPDRFINDIWDHKPFLVEITSTGRKSKEILEVGSGSGALSVFLSHLGYKVISVDNDEGVLNIAKKNSAYLNGKVTFQKADAYNLPFNNDSFDLCFSQGFFEHFQDEHIRKLLKEQLRVAKVIIFSIPTFWYPKQDFGDERLMKKEECLEILSPFNLEKAVYYAGREGQEAKPSQIYFRVIK